MSIKTFKEICEESDYTEIDEAAIPAALAAHLAASGAASGIASKAAATTLAAIKSAGAAGAVASAAPTAATAASGTALGGAAIGATIGLGALAAGAAAGYGAYKIAKHGTGAVTEIGRDISSALGSALTSISAYGKMPKNIAILSNLLCAYVQIGGGKFAMPENHADFKAFNYAIGLLEGNKACNYADNSGILILRADFGNPALSPYFRDKIRFKPDATSQSKQITFALFYPYGYDNLFRDKNGFFKKGKDLQKHILCMTNGTKIDHNVMNSFVKSINSSKPKARLV